MNFPDDIIDVLNANKDKYVIMQTTQDGMERPFLPEAFPSAEDARQAQEAIDQAVSQAAEAAAAQAG